MEREGFYFNNNKYPEIYFWNSRSFHFQTVKARFPQKISSPTKNSLSNNLFLSIAWFMHMQYTIYIYAYTSASFILFVFVVLLLPCWCVS